MFIATHAILFLVAWLAGWVAMPGEGHGLQYAAYLASINTTIGIVLIAWSLIKNHEMGAGSAAYIIGSLIGSVAMSIIFLVLGGLWRVVEMIFNFSAPPSPVLLIVIAGVAGFLLGLLLAAIASSTEE
jgi:hypothetical protein